ncbi:LemA domain protein [Ectobacillus polymachus]|uniref:LemA domain protein n=1 Tax=Ectobacillus polymachus TaxID=1508806 RepID=UPI003A8B8FBF
MEEQEQLQRIYCIAQDILIMLRNESFVNRDPHIRDSIEYLASTVGALSTIALNKDPNSNDTLQYSITKMRIARNIVEREKQANAKKQCV